MIDFSPERSIIPSEFIKIVRNRYAYRYQKTLPLDQVVLELYDYLKRQTKILDVDLRAVGINIAPAFFFDAGFVREKLGWVKI